MVENKKSIGVFTHIEKTGGVSVDWSCEQALGKRDIYIYSPKTDRFAKDSDNAVPMTSPVLEFFRSAIAAPVVGTVIANIWAGSDRVYRSRLTKKYPNLEIPDDAKLITGHFVADQFEHLLEGRQQVRGIMFREPLDRMISHYNYWHRDRGGDDWRVRVPFRRGQDFQQYFEEFAMLPEHQNHQVNALGGLDINQFDVVGVTELTDEFIEAFLQRLAQEGLTLAGQENDFPKQHLNKNMMRKKIRKEALTDQFKRDFELYHSRDYALYEQAKGMQK
jgi:hypothetical protein